MIRFAPCPFCGGTDLKIDTEDLFMGTFGNSSDGCGCIRVECRTCKTMMTEHAVFFDAEGHPDAWEFHKRFGATKSYKEGLIKLANKWNRRVYFGESFVELTEKGLANAQEESKENEQ